MGCLQAHVPVTCGGDTCGERGMQGGDRNQLLQAMWHQGSQRTSEGETRAGSLPAPRGSQSCPHLKHGLSTSRSRNSTVWLSATQLGLLVPAAPTVYKPPSKPPKKEALLLKCLRSSSQHPVPRWGGARHATAVHPEQCAREPVTSWTPQGSICNFKCTTLPVPRQFALPAYN